MDNIKCHLTSQDSLLISPSSERSYFSGSVWRLLQGVKCGFYRNLGCLWRLGSWFASWSWEQAFPAWCGHTFDKSDAQGKLCIWTPAWVPQESFMPLLALTLRHGCTPLSWVTETSSSRWPAVNTSCLPCGILCSIAPLSIGGRTETCLELKSQWRILYNLIENHMISAK